MSISHVSGPGALLLGASELYRPSKSKSRMCYTQNHKRSSHNGTTLPQNKMEPEKGTMYIAVHLVHRAYGEFQACFVGAKTGAFRMPDSYIPVRRLTLSLSARLLAFPSCMLPHDEENGLMMGSGPVKPVVRKFAREGKP